MQPSKHSLIVLRGPRGSPFQLFGFCDLHMSICSLSEAQRGDNIEHNVGSWIQSLELSVVKVSCLESDLQIQFLKLQQNLLSAACILSM